MDKVDRMQFLLRLMTPQVAQRAHTLFQEAQETQDLSHLLPRIKKAQRRRKDVRKDKKENRQKAPPSQKTASTNGRNTRVQ